MMGAAEAVCSRACGCPCDPSVAWRLRAALAGARGYLGDPGRRAATDGCRGAAPRDRGKLDAGGERLSVRWPWSAAGVLPGGWRLTNRLDLRRVWCAHRTRHAAAGLWIASRR